MGEKQETTADIIAEMRIFKCRNLETGELELCNAIANYFADRLDAALRREKAAIEADELCDLREEHIKAALSAPPRNCDVGTAEEQAERYMNFCHNYPKCTGCPCVGRIQYHQCEFAWAQLPYEEGGAK